MINLHDLKSIIYKNFQADEKIKIFKFKVTPIISDRNTILKIELSTYNTLNGRSLDVEGYFTYDSELKSEMVYNYFNTLLEE